MAEGIKNFRTFAQMMADYAFGLTDDSIAKDVRAAARRPLADTDVLEKMTSLLASSSLTRATSRRSRPPWRHGAI
jgi:hypothetical protein